MMGSQRVEHYHKPVKHELGWADFQVRSAEAALILLADSAEEGLRLAATYGSLPAAGSLGASRAEQEVLRMPMETGRPLVPPRIDSDARVRRAFPSLGASALLGVPVAARGQTIQTSSCSTC